MRPTICSLFEPHYKQNLYTNPKRTAKIFIRLILNRYYKRSACSNFSFGFQRPFLRCRRKSNPLAVGEWKLLLLKVKRKEQSKNWMTSRSAVEKVRGLVEQP